MVNNKMLTSIRSKAIEKREKISAAKGSLEEIDRAIKQKKEELNDRFSITYQEIESVIEKKQEKVEDLFDKSSKIVEGWDE